MFGLLDEQTRTLVVGYTWSKGKDDATETSDGSKSKGILQ
jgi:hypothetical protein